MQDVYYQYENSIYNYVPRIYNKCNFMPHFHKNFEMIYVESGMLDATIDGTSAVWTAGTIALLLPDQIHSFVSREPNKVWIGVFSADYVLEFAEFVDKKSAVSPVFTCDTRILELLKSQLFTAEVPDNFALKAWLYAACAEYSKCSELVPQKKSGSTIAHKILSYVSENFRENITLDSIAHELGYDKNYLSRCQHQIFHVNFRQLVNSYRLNCAKKLLHRRNTSIAEAALEAGFGNVRNFNRLWKDEYGKSPSGR